MQERWREDRDEHEAALAAGIVAAAAEGAALVCLQELTLSRYFAVDARGPAALGVEPEDLPGGPTHRFAARMAAQTGVHIHASLYERADGEDGLGYNTAIVVALRRPRDRAHAQAAHPGHGRLLRGPLLPPRSEAARTRTRSSGSPVRSSDCRRAGISGSRSSRGSTGLGGAEVLVYPTAIGSEPDHPGFDTEPLWEQVIIGNAIANGLFMVAVNRIGEEPPLRFYGSSVHLRSIRSQARAGAARRAGRARRRSRPRPARRLADAVPVPRDPPPGRLRSARPTPN